MRKGQGETGNGRHTAPLDLTAQLGMRRALQRAPSAAQALNFEDGQAGPELLCSDSVKPRPVARNAHLASPGSVMSCLSIALSSLNMIFC